MFENDFQFFCVKKRFSYPFEYIIVDFNRIVLYNIRHRGKGEFDMEKIDSKKKSHNILNVSLIFIFSILVVFFFVKDDFNGVVDVLSKAQWIFVVLAIGVFSFMYIFDALILFVLTRKSKKDYTFDIYIKWY